MYMVKIVLPSPGSCCRNYLVLGEFLHLSRHLLILTDDLNPHGFLLLVLHYKLFPQVVRLSEGSVKVFLIGLRDHMWIPVLRRRVAVTQRYHLVVVARHRVLHVFPVGREV